MTIVARTAPIAILTCAPLFVRRTVGSAARLRAELGLVRSGCSTPRSTLSTSTHYAADERGQRGRAPYQGVEMPRCGLNSTSATTSRTRILDSMDILRRPDAGEDTRRSALGARDVIAPAAERNKMQATCHTLAPRA